MLHEVSFAVVGLVPKDTQIDGVLFLHDFLRERGTKQCRLYLSKLGIPLFPFPSIEFFPNLVQDPSGKVGLSIISVLPPLF